MNWQDYLKSFGEDALVSYAILFIVALLLTSIILFVRRLTIPRLKRWASKTITRWDNVVLDILTGLKPVVLFSWIFYFLCQFLDSTLSTNKSLLFVMVALTAIQVAVWGFFIIRTWKEDFLNRRIEQDVSAAGVLGILYFFIQSSFIVAVVLVALSNVGVDIGALIAGLGVGGIAVALAAQNILGDLLASLSIVLDKPFVVGDFIIVGEDKGTVDKIGIRSTQVRSLSGEQLVFSNKDLLQNTIRNYKRMWERRVVQSFGVVYSTSPARLKEIPLWVKGFVEELDGVRFDRCHFCKYGDSSLDFELVFWVASPDYTIYMDLQQTLLLKITEKFNNEGVEFAFPTRTLYMEKQ